MSFTRTIIAALVLAAALPAWAAGAQDLRSPDAAALPAWAAGAQDLRSPDAASLRMQVLRDRNAPDPPPIVQDLRTSNTRAVGPPAAAPSHEAPSASGDAWLEVALLGAVALLLAGGALVVSRRRRLATRS
jgi:hypothetical protein